MPQEETHFFRTSFEQITGHSAYPWQEKLFQQIIAGAWPEAVDLPTGAGKTAVLYVWLLALAWSLKTRMGNIPRRLVWVVNRRVVVDQVTAEVLELVTRLDRVPEVRALLAEASVQNVPLAISTLRGQHADSGDWSRDPSTPAVVVGTVDMIGSRLLFRGYQAGPYYRPIYAGLLAVDSLIVNDEAHLSPAFAELLKTLHEMRPAERITGKAFRILLLSATHGGNSGTAFDHSPEEDAGASAEFRSLFEAPKRLELHEVARAGLNATMWRLAIENPVGRTVVFIEKPEEAAEFHARLKAARLGSALLTGTMRGYERDSLVSDPVFQAFLQRKYEGPPVWLVCTSAGEVGINITCDRMITGLVEADHLLQRFGRLNRFGHGTGLAHVVYSAPAEKEPKLVVTLNYLQHLNGDVSCKSVWRNRPSMDAISEKPALAKLESWRIETWAQTSFRDSALDPVDSWLHGKQEDNGPETELVWRDDIQRLTEWGVSPADIAQVLQSYPVVATEILREPSSRVLNKFKKLSETRDANIVVIEADGNSRIRSLRDIAASDTVAAVGYKRLLLPSGLGTLDAGMFRAEAAASDVRFDVADRNPEHRRRRYLISENGTAPIGVEESEEPGDSPKEFARFARDNGYRVPVIVRNPKSESELLLYFGARRNWAKPLTNVALSTHQSEVSHKAVELSQACGLSDLADLYREAGELHDEGKRNEVWQRAMGGSMEEPLAKSASPRNPRLIGGYRHELGSVLKATNIDDDLLLHLIATHHAAGRPFFTQRQFDRDELRNSASASLEQTRRFGRLQSAYGPWGLAYLEAIFKCADGLVSSEEGEAASA